MIRRVLSVAPRSAGRPMTPHVRPAISVPGQVPDPVPTVPKRGYHEKDKFAFEISLLQLKGRG